MNKKFIAVSIFLVAGLALLATQAFATPVAALDPKTTPGTPHIPPGQLKTPGAQATAHAGLRGKHQNYRGVIAEVSASSLTLTLSDGTPVVFALSPATRIHIPGPKNSGATLQPGMQAMVQAIADANGALTARAVMAIPGKPTRVHRVGVVTAYTPGASITIQAADGNTYTFTLGSNVKILPKERAGTLAVGSRVTVIAPRNPSGTTWTAIGIVIHPDGAEQETEPAPGFTETSSPPAATAAPTEETATPNP